MAWAAIRTPAFIGPPDGVPVALAPLPAPWMALAAAVTVATVAVAAVVPAWRAGRVSPVAAVASSPPRGRLSRLARIGLLVRLPVPLVLGARDAFTRRLPAALTIVGVAIPMAMITIAMTCWTTLDGFTSDPGRIDLAAALTVYPGSESIHAEQAQLARDPQIAADYPGAEFDTLLPGATATFTARAMGTSPRPYPFDVAQGAMFDSYNEAIAGQGLLDLLHYNVGDWIEVTVDGVPMIFHIVGRTLDPANNGDVLDFGLDALAFNGAADQPQFYSLVLKPGVDPAAARLQLLRLSGDRLQVQQAANPADGLGVRQGRHHHRDRRARHHRPGQPPDRHRRRPRRPPARGRGPGRHRPHPPPGHGHPGRQHHDPDRLRRRRSAPPRAWRSPRSWSTPRARPAASAGASRCMPSVGVIAAMLALTLTVATVAALLLARRSARAPEPLAPPRRPLATPRPSCLKPRQGQVKPAQPSSRTDRALRVHGQQLLTPSPSRPAVEWAPIGRMLARDRHGSTAHAAVASLSAYSG